MDVVEVPIVEVAGVPGLPGGQAAHPDRLPVGDHRAEREHLDEALAQLLDLRLERRRDFAALHYVNIGASNTAMPPLSNTPITRPTASRK
jgi:hypothetical protein